MSQELIDAGYRFVRANTRGELRFDEHLQPIKLVIGPEGRPLGSVMVAMLTTVDTVIYLPDCRDNAMEMQVTLVELDEEGPQGALTDRWRIYHGDPPDVRWALFDIDMARYKGEIIDGNELMRPNPLADDEARLCKFMNTRHADDLRLMCPRFAGVEVESPVMVGIDPDGIDVRGRFDVLRIEFPEPRTTAEEAEQALDDLMAGARGEKEPA